jgi:NADP-dependent 3-hydroxy acid dehydrogenase YdfG
MTGLGKRLDGKVAWITGSGRGIGKETALAMAQAGAKIVLCSRSQSEIDAGAREITLANGQAVAIVCDISQRNEVESLVNKVHSKWGDVNILINNAGVAVFDKVINTRDEDWDSMMYINLKGSFLCTQAVLKSMIARQSGDIINIVSVAGRVGYRNCAGYCASKFGLFGFTEVLRKETRKYGIRVTAVMPGATDTMIWGNTNVDRSKMMLPEQVAQTILSVCCAPIEVMPEEIVMRPIGGDL